MELWSVAGLLGLGVVGVGAVPIIDPQALDSFANASIQNPFYAIYFLLAGLFFLVIWIAYKQFQKSSQVYDDQKKQIELAQINNDETVKALNKFANNQEKLINKFNAIPCVQNYKEKEHTQTIDDIK